MVIGLQIFLIARVLFNIVCIFKGYYIWMLSKLKVKTCLLLLQCSRIYVHKLIILALETLNLLENCKIRKLIQSCLEDSTRARYQMIGFEAFCYMPISQLMRLSLWCEELLFYLIKMLRIANCRENQITGL